MDSEKVAGILGAIVAAVVLGTLVSGSLFLTLGFSMTVWFWMFASTACILGVAGAFNTAGSLGAPRWVGFALASPGLAYLESPALAKNPKLTRATAAQVTNCRRVFNLIVKTSPVLRIEFPSQNQDARAD